jgi:hypothetical protein
MVLRTSHPVGIVIATLAGCLALLGEVVVRVPLFIADGRPVRQVLEVALFFLVSRSIYFVIGSVVVLAPLLWLTRMILRGRNSRLADLGIGGVVGCAIGLEANTFPDREGTALDASIFLLYRPSSFVYVLSFVVGGFIVATLWRDTSIRYRHDSA